MRRASRFDITGATIDTIEGRFLAPAPDPDDLAKRIHAFCPDIVDQGVGSVDALAEELPNTDQLVLWWD